MADSINCTTVTDREGNTIDVYENDISLYLHQYMNDRSMTDDDMSKAPQSKWNAALLYVNKYLFKPNRDRLLVEPPLSDAYNIELIDSICNIYIDLCYEYDKEISIMGFSKLTGINQDTFHRWGNRETRVSSKAYEIYKKLNTENEESLSGLLISGKRNPVGILGALNRRHGWNMGQPRGTDGTQRIAASREEIAARAGVVEQLPGSVEELPD